MIATFPNPKNSYLSIFAILLFFFTVYISNAQVGINTITPNSTLEVNGSVGHKIAAITTTTTLDGTYNTIICDNGSTAITINLPTAITPSCNGRVYTIKKGMSSTAAVTIDGFGSETIDGASTFLLSDELGTVVIVSDGTEWKIISKHLSPYPLGEISYFNIAGTSITIPLQSSTGSDYLVVCVVPTPATSDPATNKLQSKPTNEFITDGNGRLTYNGKTTRPFHIACTISAKSSSSTDRYVFGVGRNGNVLAASRVIQKMSGSSDTQSTALHVVAVLAEGDYLELMSGNLTNPGTNITINSLCLFALGM